MPKKCLGNLNRDCSGNCIDYKPCLEKSMGTDIKNEVKDARYID
jgi:hypothetical protein